MEELSDRIENYQRVVDSLRLYKPLLSSEDKSKIREYLKYEREDINYI